MTTFKVSYELELDMAPNSINALALKTLLSKGMGKQAKNLEVKEV